jgi:hypothetical protein
MGLFRTYARDISGASHAALVQQRVEKLLVAFVREQGLRELEQEELDQPCDGRCCRCNTK